MISTSVGVEHCGATLSEQHRAASLGWLKLLLPGYSKTGHACSLVPRPLPFYVLQFAFSIIYGSGRPVFHCVFNFHVLYWRTKKGEAWEWGYRACMSAAKFRPGLLLTCIDSKHNLLWIFHNGRATVLHCQLFNLHIQRISALSKFVFATYLQPLYSKHSRSSYMQLL